MSADPFPQTRAAALARWQAFLPATPGYAESRGHVAPGHAGVSRLSPAVRCRLVTEDELVTGTLERFPAATTEKWLQEIFWRRYWKGWLEQRPAVWTLYRERLRWHREQAPEPVLQRAEEVAAGRSGVALMDRFARELRETGYLHNHARMWWASFWIHVERLPWELGADFFYRHLLDADPASNTLSWRWVAGLHLNSKPYLVRRSNLDKFCAPEWLVDSTGLDRLADERVQPWVPVVDRNDEAAVEWAKRERESLELVRFQPFPSRPATLPERFGLWLHDEDLTPELSRLGELKPAAVAAFASQAFQQVFGLSPVRSAFQQAALSDACVRAAGHYGVLSTTLEATTLAEGLGNWARQQRLAAVVAFAPAVGPLNDQLPGIRESLTAAGAELILCRRHTDFELWPYAKQGFFPFWEQVQLWLRSRQKRGELPVVKPV